MQGDSQGNIHPTRKISDPVAEERGMAWGDVPQATTAATLSQQLARRERCPAPMLATLLMEAAPGLHISLAM